MNLEIRIVTILMCAALTLGSCTKKTITPDEDPQPVEVGFTASSQAVWVKGETDPKTTFPYTNFGVWGIARHEQVEDPYILWPIVNDQLTAVNAPAGTQTNQETSNVVFTPATPAYWLRDYDYTFLAIAPNADSGFTLVEVNQASGSSSSDSMTFTYDMSGKYAEGNYTFDLLGAAGQKTVDTGGYSTAQELTFWHLMSQIEINVSFATDLQGNQINGEVTGIRLGNVASNATYTISHNVGNTLSVNCVAGTTKGSLSFTSSPATMNIVPQNVKNADLYIDVIINRDQDDQASYRDLKVSLNVPENEADYIFNGRYKWNIKIGTGAAITFDVEISDWEPATEENDGFDPEIDM